MALLAVVLIDRRAALRIARARGHQRLALRPLRPDPRDDRSDLLAVERPAVALAVARHRRARAAVLDRARDEVVGRALEERRVDERRRVIGLVALGVGAVTLT